MLCDYIVKNMFCTSFLL